MLRLVLPRSVEIVRLFPSSTGYQEHSHQRFQRGISVFGKRGVERLTTQTRPAGDLGHALGAGDVAQDTGDFLWGPVFDSDIEIAHHIIFGG